MARRKRITVRGKQRADIDPLAFLHVLLAIGDEWDEPTESRPSPDVHQAAIEDRQERSS